MEFVLTKNNLVDLNVFFYKEGFTNIHRANISLIKIDSATKTTPIFHIGFKNNMGYISGNRVYTGVMVFEVLEGYPLQSIMFANNDNPTNEYQQSLEDLDAIDFYCIQKKNKDPYGDFVLRNLKFIDTKMTQSTEEFSRKLVATFVCSDKIPFRLPYFFNQFKSDNYSSHLIRSKKEMEEICQDLDSSESYLSKEFLNKYCVILSEINTVGTKSVEHVKECLRIAFEEVVKDFTFRRTIKRNSAIYRIRDFIYEFYKFRNEYEYAHIQDRGDLDFLKFMNLGETTDMVLKNFGGGITYNEPIY